MKRRSRLLRVAKWGGVPALIALGALWLVSCRVAVSRYDATGRWQLWMANGAVGVAERPYPKPPLRSGWRIERVWWPRTEWRPGHLTLITLHGDPDRDRSEVYQLPFWIPMLLISMPMLYLWRLDRRALPGHCPCGYDLTGTQGSAL